MLPPGAQGAMRGSATIGVRAPALEAPDRSRPPAAGSGRITVPDAELDFPGPVVIKTSPVSRRRPLRCAVLCACICTATVAQPWTLVAQSVASGPAGASSVRIEDLQEWLGYLASDELQGRQVFTEGYGLAAQYVASHLASWGVTPLGSNGSYLQPVRLRGHAVTRNSSVTVAAGGRTATFEHGDHVTFAV